MKTQWRPLTINIWIFKKHFNAFCNKSSPLRANNLEASKRVKRNYISMTFLFLQGVYEGELERF